MTTLELFSLLDHAADGAFVTDAEGRIVYWGRSAEKAFGLGSGQTYGKHCWELLQASGCPASATCSADCASRETAVALRPTSPREMRMQGGEGSKWYSVSFLGVPVSDKPRSVVVHLCRDVDRAKQLQDSATRCAEEMRRLASLTHEEPPASISLTHREGEVLRLCARGKSSNQIANLLGISPVTVRNHVQHMLKKLECHSRVEAVLRARDLGQI